MKKYLNVFYDMGVKIGAKSRENLEIMAGSRYILCNLERLRVLFVKDKHGSIKKIEIEVEAIDVDNKIGDFNHPNIVSIHVYNGIIKTNDNYYFNMDLTEQSRISYIYP